MKALSNNRRPLLETRFYDLEEQKAFEIGTTESGKFKRETAHAVAKIYFWRVNETIAMRGIMNAELWQALKS